MRTCVDFDASHIHRSCELQHETQQHHQQNSTAPERSREQPRHAENCEHWQSDKQRCAASHIQILLEENMEDRIGIYFQAKLA